MSSKQTFPITKDQRKVWTRAFRMWQKRPHEVAPLSEEQQVCASCGTEFQGNYCPRCGQAAQVGRFSFKKAFLLFLDVWGMGNRGMFRSIRDLMLRPGYMIRDYISGHQSAYFPPFKMFFVLATISLLLSHGLNIGLDEETQKESQTEIVKQNDQEEDEQSTVSVNGKRADKKKLLNLSMLPRYMSQFNKKNPALFSFLMLLLISLPLYLFMRRCPAIPDLRFSEHIVAQVYTSNMYSLYMILARLMPLNLLKDIIQVMACIMIFVALHQFSGYSKRRLLGYAILTIFITVIAIVIVGIIVGYAAYALDAK